MIANITNYFSNLNNAGQALFIVGVLLVITFIILLIIVLKPEKNTVKKIYGESEVTDRENAFEEKMKDVDNVSANDINLENEKTRNLKNIVDELKQIENKNNVSVMDRIAQYEDEQEDTAIISVEELLKANESIIHRPVVEPTYEVPKKEIKRELVRDDDFLFIDEEDYQTGRIQVIKEEPKKEVFSSVYNEPKNEEYLNKLKQFRNNL